MFRGTFRPYSVKVAVTCGLSNDEIDIVTYLYKGRCLSPDPSIGLNAIKRDLGSHITNLED